LETHLERISLGQDVNLQEKSVVLSNEIKITPKSGADYFCMAEFDYKSDRVRQTFETVMRVNLLMKKSSTEKEWVSIFDVFKDWYEFAKRWRKLGSDPEDCRFYQACLRKLAKISKLSSQQVKDALTFEFVDLDFKEQLHP